MVRLSLLLVKGGGKCLALLSSLVFSLLLGSLLLAGCDGQADNINSANPTGTLSSQIMTTSAPNSGGTLPATAASSTKVETATTVVPTNAPVSSVTPTLALPTTPVSFGSTGTKDAVDMQTAWGATLQQAQVKIATDNDHIFIVDTITPDAKFLVGTVEPRKFGSENAKVALISTSDQQITLIRDLPTPDTQLIGADADSDWIVWSEASRQPDFGDWILYAYNRSTKQIKQISKAPVDKDGNPLASPYVLPKLDHSTVVWEEATTESSKVKPIGVKSADLVTGQIKTLAPIGRTPHISWPYVGWAEPVSDPSAQENYAKSVIVMLNMETGEKKTLHNPNTPLYFSFYKDTVMWITTGGSEVRLTDINETYQKTLATTTSDIEHFQFPTISGRLVTWTSDKTEQVWDLLRNQLVTLSDQSTVTACANGNGFVWAAGTFNDQDLKDKENGLISNRGVYNIIDTSTLPTT